MPDAVVAGHLCLDIIPSFSGEVGLEPGKMVVVGETTLATGGGVSNVGLALLTLGVNTRLLGSVGDDTFGEAVKKVLRSYDSRAADAVRTREGESTSYTIVINPPGTDRSFLHHPGCNDTFDPSDIDIDKIAAAKLFYFGYPPLMKQVYSDGGAALAEAFEGLRAEGMTTVLDMTLPDPNAPSGRVDWAAFLRRVLPHTDVFLPSLPELLFMLRRELYDEGGWQTVPQPSPLLPELANEVLELGVAIAGLKLGADGLYLKTAETSRLNKSGRAGPEHLETWAGRELWSPVFEVEVNGTVGAGDATLAGFLAALLKGSSPEEALSMACAVGAYSVEARDASSGIQSWRATEERMARGWARAQSPRLDAWRLQASGVYARL